MLKYMMLINVGKLIQAMILYFILIYYTWLTYSVSVNSSPDTHGIGNKFAIIGLAKHIFAGRAIRFTAALD